MFVTPGLVFEALRERTRPRRSASAFRETATIILGSVAFSALATVVLASMKNGGTHDWLPDPAELLRDPGGYTTDHIGKVSAGLAAEVGLATLLAMCWHGVLYNLNPGGRYSGNPAWHELVSGEGNPERRVVFASVELMDGTRWRGRIKAVDLKDDGSVAFIVLGSGSGPLERTDPGQQAPVVVDPQWGYVTIAGERVKTVTLAYL